jgi:dihydrofolate reductase
MIRAAMSVSLGGFITGPNPGPDQGLGDGGEVLHDWLTRTAGFREWFGQTGGERGVDNDVLNGMINGVGSSVLGHEMLRVSEKAWGWCPPFGGTVYVLTRTPGPPLVKGFTTFEFVGDYPSAMARARKTAGDLDVAVPGGGSTVSQALAAGDLDELLLTVVPVLLGGGTPLFTAGLRLTLTRTEVIASPTGVVHLRYRR